MRKLPVLQRRPGRQRLSIHSGERAERGAVGDEHSVCEPGERQLSTSWDRGITCEERDPHRISVESHFAGAGMGARASTGNIWRSVFWGGKYRNPIWRTVD